MKKAVAVCWGAALLSLGVVVAAEDAPARLVATAAEGGPVVSAIQIKNLGAGQVDEGFIRTRMTSKQGDPLDRQAISKDVKALLETGHFSSVDASVDVSNGAAVILFSVRIKFKLRDPVVVNGVTHFRESKIRDLLDLQVGDLVDDQVMGVRIQKVLEEYRADYFPDAQASWRIEQENAATGLATVTLTVDEGTRAVVKEARFIGNEHISDSTLRGIVKQRSRWNPMWLLRKKRYVSDDLETARLDIRDLYQNQGYLDAVVDLPVLEKIDGTGLRIVVHIQEGKTYKIGTIALNGVTLFKEKDLLKEIRAKSGDVASAGVIDAAAQAVRDYYGGRGYINTTVRPVKDTVAATGIANITFRVTEGALAHIRNVVIQGNTRTRDKVIRRELLVYPGDIYDEVKIRRSERIVRNLGYFKSVRSVPVATPGADEKDLVFQVEEQPTGNIMLGAGFSSVDNLMVFLDLMQANFDIASWPPTGGGQKLRLHTQVSSKRKDYNLSFTEPWFLDRKLSLGFDVYRREAEYSDYQVTRTGGAISLGKSLPGANRLDFRYRLERSELGANSDSNEYFYVDSPHDSYYFNQEPSRFTESSLTVSLTHDDRDNPFIPSRGNRTSVSATLTGGPMGFDTEMYDLGLTAVQYVPLWFHHVFSVRTRWEVVDGYGGTDSLPIDDRLFIGGGRTLRGYHYRDVGPKVSRTVSDATGETTYHKPVGGQTLAMASAEYFIPVVSKIRLAGFYDIGNVWRDPYEVDLGSLASSAGVGVRFDIPMFPIRIDYAWPIEKDNELTREDKWVFWIGYDF